MHFAIGFIGFGEAASSIAGGLRTIGTSAAAFDIHSETPGLSDTIQRRARETGTQLVASPSELARACDLLFSTVTSSSALDAARQNAPFLGPRHTYADLNSVSPALKREIAAVVDGTGAAFVEVAVMAPVRPYQASLVTARSTPAPSSANRLTRSGKISS